MAGPSARSSSSRTRAASRSGEGIEALAAQRGGEGALFGGRQRREVLEGVGLAGRRDLALAARPAWRRAHLAAAEQGGQAAAQARVAGIDGVEDQPAEPGMDRQPGDAAATRGERSVRSAADAERGEQLLGMIDAFGRGRLEPREAARIVAMPGLEQERHRGEVDALDLGIAVGGAAQVLLGRPQAQAAPGCGAPGAPGALVGGGAADALEHQGVEAAVGVEAADPRQAAVDDRAHAGDGERGLGDIGREDHPLARARAQGALLLLQGEPAVQRQDLGVAAGGQRSGGRADLAHPGQEDQDVAAVRLAQGLAHRVGDLRAQAGVARDAAVAQRHRMRPAAGADHRSAIEEARHRRRIHGRRHHHQREVLAHRAPELGQPGEGEVAVEVALVELVEDHRLHPVEVGIVLQAAGEGALGHHP